MNRCWCERIKQAAETPAPASSSWPGREQKKERCGHGHFCSSVQACQSTHHYKLHYNSLHDRRKRIGNIILQQINPFRDFFYFFFAIASFLVFRLPGRHSDGRSSDGWSNCRGPIVSDSENYYLAERWETDIQTNSDWVIDRAAVEGEKGWTMKRINPRIEWWVHWVNICNSQPSIAHTTIMFFQFWLRKYWMRHFSFGTGWCDFARAWSNGQPPTDEH